MASDTNQTLASELAEPVEAVQDHSIPVVQRDATLDLQAPGISNPYLTPEAINCIEVIRNDRRADVMLKAVPPERIDAAIDAIAEPSDYNYLPEAVYSALAEVENLFGANGLGLYKKSLIVRMIDNIPAKLDAQDLPQAVRGLYPDMLDYVTKTLGETPNAQYLLGEDLVRDLRLVATRSIPCDAPIIDNPVSCPTLSIEIRVSSRT